MSFGNNVAQDNGLRQIMGTYSPINSNQPQQPSGMGQQVSFLEYPALTLMPKLPPINPQGPLGPFNHTVTINTSIQPQVFFSNSNKKFGGIYAPSSILSHNSLTPVRPPIKPPQTELDPFLVECKSKLKQQTVPMRVFFNYKKEIAEKETTGNGQKLITHKHQILKFMPGTLIGESSLTNKEIYQIRAAKIKFTLPEGFTNPIYHFELICNHPNAVKPKSVSLKFEESPKKSFTIIIPSQDLDTINAKRLTMRANCHHEKTYHFHNIKATLTFPHLRMQLSFIADIAMLSTRSFNATLPNAKFFKDSDNTKFWFNLLYSKKVTCIETDINLQKSIKLEYSNDPFTFTGDRQINDPLTLPENPSKNFTDFHVAKPVIPNFKKPFEIDLPMGENEKKTPFLEKPILLPSSKKTIIFDAIPLEKFSSSSNQVIPLKKLSSLNHMKTRDASLKESSRPLKRQKFDTIDTEMKESIQSDQEICLATVFDLGLPAKPAMQAIAEKMDTIPAKVCRFGVLPLEIPPFTESADADLNTRYQNAVLFAFAATNFKDSKKLALELSNPNLAQLRKKIREGAPLPEDRSLSLLGSIKLAANQLNLKDICDICTIEIYTADKGEYKLYKTINDQALHRLRLYKRPETNAQGQFFTYDVLLKYPKEV